MAGSLSNLDNNPFKRINWIKCKFEHDKTRGIKNKQWDCFLEYTNFKDDLIEGEAKLSRRV